ncbi:hypothetical protein ABRP17_016380 [Stenotrophomonas sp. WHRI 8082]|uniref:hypothetical protein n=1 Tax=Stenotrophomonas sp. WHRI 8082 TaxID=3162571 RepID=UPI0032ECFAEC
MLAVAVMIPCFEWSPSCRLDWSAIAALGGWAAAAMTFFAVLLPVRQLRKAASARDASDFVEGQIAVRRSVISLVHFHTGIGAISYRVDNATGIDDFTESLGLVGTYIVQRPFPDLPQIPTLANLRIQMARLEATLTNLASYVDTYEMGAFDAGIVQAFIVTVDIARDSFNDVIEALDDAVPGSNFQSTLAPFRTG